MSVFDRLGRVVRAEWNQRRQKSEGAPAPRKAGEGVAATVVDKKPAVVDIQGALRVLELSGTPDLAQVRAQYRALSRRYHPKTVSAKPDEAHAARVVLEALTDALEILEAHLLPLPATAA